MADTGTEVVDTLNDLAERRFLVELRLAEVNQQHKAAVAQLENEHQTKLSELQADIDALDAQIYQTISSNRQHLIERGKQSVVIMKARFQFKKSDAKTKIKDADGFIKTARKLGVVRKVAKLVHMYKLDHKSAMEWLDKHGEMRQHFAAHLEEIEAGESLTMQPNSNYTVHHDSKRVSPPPVRIQTS